MEHCAAGGNTRKRTGGPVLTGDVWARSHWDVQSARARPPPLVGGRAREPPRARALVMTALHRASGAAHESHEFCSRGFKYETPGKLRLPGGDDEAWPYLGPRACGMVRTFSLNHGVICQGRSRVHSSCAAPSTYPRACFHSGADEHRLRSLTGVQRTTYPHA